MSPKLRYTETPETGSEDYRKILRLLPYLMVYRGRVLLAMLALILAKFATVGVPFILKDIVDSFDGAPQFGLIPLGLLATYGLLRFCSAGFNELRDNLFCRVRYNAMKSLSLDVLKHLHAQSLRYHLERRTGNISRDLQRASEALGNALNFLAFQILPTFIELGLVFGVLLYNYDVNFTLLAIFVVVLYAFFTIKVTNWRMHHRIKMNKLDSQANGQAIDSLLNYETVKYFNNESLETQRYQEGLEKWSDAAVKSQLSISMLNFGQSGIVTLGVVAMLTMATHGVSTGALSIGDLVLINAMMLQLFVPLNFLGTVYRMLRYALADMAHVVDLIDTTPEIIDSPLAQPLTVTEGRISFDNVSFAYQQDREILKGVSFKVLPGEKVAIVGPSGAGKSTLSRLLFQFYRPSQGTISIDGQDLSLCQQDSVRSAFGIVPQDTVLFNETLRYNLAYASPSASEEDIEEAIQQADLGHFIAALPEGLETRVGERGLKLSGGEKQRVAIARVLLKKPPLLIFDEATSSLDTQSEQQILQAFKRVEAQRTTLVIAHRLSTISDADQILVLDNGVIVEQGNHQNLMDQHGLYAELWSLQQHENED